MRSRLRIAIASIAVTGLLMTQAVATQEHYRLTTAFTGHTQCLDVVNDGQNDQVQLARCANVSGQMWDME